MIVLGAARCRRDGGLLPGHVRRGGCGGRVADRLAQGRGAPNGGRPQADGGMLGQDGRGGKRCACAGAVIALRDGLFVCRAVNDNFRKDKPRIILS